VYKRQPQEQLIAAQAELDDAEAQLRQAQAAYDQVSWREDVGRLPESLQLEQANNAYRAAQARLDELNRGATAAEIASAQAQVRQAQAELDAIQVPARPSAIASAQAELRRAQAELDLLSAGARPEAIEMAQAEVASAQASLDEAKAALAETELRAPFAGTLVELTPAVGEQVSPGEPLVRLADLTVWQVETDDLTEFNVYKVVVGAPATIQFDAIPGLSLPGRVSSVKAIGENKQGDITYTVVVIPDQSDERLRWNMTAVVTIETGDD
jgi:multidrug resistance efflux pump